MKNNFSSDMRKSIHRAKKLRPIEWNVSTSEESLWADFHWGHIVVRKVKNLQGQMSWLATLVDTKANISIDSEYRDHAWSAQIDAEYLLKAYSSNRKKVCRKPNSAIMTLEEAVKWIAYNDEPKDLKASSISGYISTQLAADIFGVKPMHVARMVSKIRRGWLVDE